ncbi:helix-turn-helix domain-containing protein [Kitasatospora aureofaciens]|uniref:helix-turn-helix domain-containing protein n=1 Tax=Kitasatospora aureofaciens TaxID=1894 RepID=UPI0033F4BAC8
MSAPPVGATWHRGVDLFAVERFERGEHPLPPLTPEEKRYAAIHTRLPIKTIAARLGVHERQVSRWREEAARDRD